MPLPNPAFFLLRQSAENLSLARLGRRDVIGRFDGGRMTSDGGELLLREVDKRVGLLDRLADCFSDDRNPNAIEHSVHALVAQRVYGLALGYEDLNDHDVLRKDSVLPLLVGKQDLIGGAGAPAGSGEPAGGLEYAQPPGAEHAGGGGKRSAQEDCGGPRRLESLAG